MATTTHSNAVTGSIRVKPVLTPASAAFGLLAGTLLAAALGDALARMLPPNAVVAADPDLARLLLGMTAIKLLLVAGMAALTLWRLRRPASLRVALRYAGCVWTAVLATALIAQSVGLIAASLLFHGAWIAFAWLGLRDDAVLPALVARSARR